MDFKYKDWSNKIKRKKLDYTEIVNEKNDLVFTFDETTNNEIFKQNTLIELNSLPIDWSLKSRVRFSSKNPFPWQGKFRACEDAEGTISFVRCLPDNYNNKELLKENNLKDNIFSPNKRLMKLTNTQNYVDQLYTQSHTSELRRYCFTWMYPNIPWIKMFPRIDSFNKLNKNESFFKDLKSLHCTQLKNEWCLSLKSLFYLVKARQCAFFYVCCNNFTILFRAAGVAAIDSIHAIITPTSNGLRNKLREEGIVFTMPLMDQKDLENNLESIQNVIEGTDDSGFPIEEDSQLFLESLGLSQQDFPTSKPKLSQIQKEDKRKTMVFIKGQNINLLINFLTNTDLIISTTGQMIGIPPTLIAPIAFSNASLHSLKLKSTLTNHNLENIYNLDLIGPILPNILHDIINFFKNTIKNFNVTIVNCDTTTPFTTFSSSSNENSANLISLFASENLKDCGLSKDLINKICKKPHQSKKIMKCIEVNANEFKITI